MFNDDGIGQAMQQAYAEQLGKDAQTSVKRLEARVQELERKLHAVVSFMEDQVALNKIYSQK